MKQSTYFGGLTIKRGNTPLMKAVAFRNKRECQMLLERNVDPNEPSASRSKNTSAIYAATIGDESIFALLLEKKANPNLANVCRVTPLLCAAKNGHLLICDQLLKYRPKINLNHQDERGNTALIHAAIQKNTDVCSLLIEEGADLNIVEEDDNSTALILSAKYGFLPESILLLNAGAIHSIQDWCGKTALTNASERGHLEIVQALIAVNADPNIRDNLMRTALSYASERGHLEIVQALIAQGADTNLVDDHNETALHKAARNKHLEICKCLAEQMLQESIVVLNHNNKSALEVWGGRVNLSGDEIPREDLGEELSDDKKDFCAFIEGMLAEVL